MKVLRIFLAVLAILGLGGTLTTMVALHRGGAEGNHFMVTVVSHGFYAMEATEVLFLAGAYLIGRALIRAGRSYAIYIPLLLCIAEKGAIVASNIHVIHTLGRN